MDEIVKSTQAFLSWCLSIDMMDEIEVDIIDLQAPQAVFDRFHDMHS